jgi:hypothetical protein
MDESQIVEVWTMFKEYLDKKHVEMAAERFVDLLADYGVSDQTLIDSLGGCSTLDAAINYYLDMDEDEEYIEDDDWD